MDCDADDAVGLLCNMLMADDVAGADYSHAIRMPRIPILQMLRPVNEKNQGT